MSAPRTDPNLFRLPARRIASGYYSDAYFNQTKAIMERLAREGKERTVCMQVFQKKDAILGGIDEAIAVLKQCSGWAVPLAPGGERVAWEGGWDRLDVRALTEGCAISPYEPVMHIIGPYHLFAHLETVYLGTLARRTLIATNVDRVVKAARGKPIFFFPARHDHWLVQTGDGLMANLVGAAGVSTEAQASWWGGQAMGTVPHALIAACDGNTVLAAQRFVQEYPGVNLTVLVDFMNDSVQTALDVAEALGSGLWGVRLDTSESMMDTSLLPYALEGHSLLRGIKPTGVNPALVRLVREHLDSFGYPDVHIVCSGGFTAEKITQFERDGVPVDAYGVGSSLIRGDNAFTADIVRVDGRPLAKAGRSFIENRRLEVVN